MRPSLISSNPEDFKPMPGWIDFWDPRRHEKGKSKEEFPAKSQVRKAVEEPPMDVTMGKQRRLQ